MLDTTQPSLALLTDLYQLTMAAAYHASGMEATDACFHLFFRNSPFGGGYAIACGLEQAIDYLDGLRFTKADIAYLAERTGNDGRPLFGQEFLGWLAELQFCLDVDAIPEGTAVFPREPLLRVSGPIVQCQLVETALLNAVNFQTLVATKASRVCLAAAGDSVVEFGLRRAQGPDGGLSASRAAYVGGCVGTSNTLAGARFGIPVSGTHAHSWVMAWDTELEAFEAYAEALPNNCTFVVDTYDSLEGARHAVEIGRKLREQGHEMIGVRIDSGDLAWLSKRVREILDEGGFAEAHIVASNELDEHLITSLKDQGAAIDMWGVGTKLATAWDQPALGGVYKLSAVRPDGEAAWTPRVKVSEQTAKVTTPGVLGVRRYRREDGSLSGDMVWDVTRPPSGEVTMIDPADSTRCKRFAADATSEELLVPVFRAGRLVYERPAIAQVRDRATASLASLDPSITRFLNPHTYPVGLEKSVNDVRTELVLKARGLAENPGK
ncbi:MAG: nicotinate phosphoribosyltransferase [Coriobacteriia bacterium]|nr:nicotinate phosphoribosyltransferase [Coriobacteriia bacterium]